MNYTYNKGVSRGLSRTSIIALALGFALTLVLSVFSIVSAADTDIKLYNSDAITSGGMGNSTDAFVGDGSWQNDQASSSLFYSLPIAELGTFTIDEIENIQFSTKRLVADTTGFDFFMNIYTTHDGIDDDASWYGHRLTIDPIYSGDYDDSSDDWVTWDTNGAGNTPVVYDSNHSSFGWYTSGANTAAYMSDIQSGLMDWSQFLSTAPASSIDYGSEVVGGITIATGTAWNASFAGLIDGLEIDLVNGDTLTIDLEDEYLVSGQIISPAEGETVGGLYDLVATYDDGEDDVVPLNWAVRTDSANCGAGTDIVFGGGPQVGTPDNEVESESWDGATFNASIDTTLMEDGEYCFVFNPLDDGDVDIREVSHFVVNNTPDSKDDCKQGGWTTFFSPVFRNQGDCVSWIASDGQSRNNPGRR